MIEFDVAIVGAGMAGLTCAQLLDQAGYTVVVVDKSRGLGGRLATRRLQGTHADHGVCYLKPKDPSFQALLNYLVDRKVARVWTETIHELDQSGQIQAPLETAPRYVAATGITAIAKFLARGLTLRLGQRVELIGELDRGWQLEFESEAPITAKALIVAIPAPQAAVLCKSLASQLNKIQFTPCISAIAVYPIERQVEVERLGLNAIICPHDPELGWIGFDSTKQLDPVQPVVVVQSNATFANQYLEASDLQAVGNRLLQKSAQVAAEWLSEPETLQVHRWRYAFPINPLPQKFLATDTKHPLFCTGDWCGGNRVESAFQAGLDTAAQINQRLDRRSLPAQFWTAIG